MKIPIYQVDAFADKLFGGNPAAVCPLEDWLDDATLQRIAMENNLSETAFIVKDSNDYQIRWFTPATEVKLCGHATLATAHVLFTQLKQPGNTVSFHSKSGILTVTLQPDDRLTLDFPATIAEPAQDIPVGLLEGLGLETGNVFKSSFDYMVVVEGEHLITALTPDFKTLATVPCRGVIVTAKSTAADFVSRCFYPQSGIDEDPVTGSAHTIMVPYWSKQLGKTRLTAIQISQRRGYLDCELSGDRVLMTGRAIHYMKGEIEI